MHSDGETSDCRRPHRIQSWPSWSGVASTIISRQIEQFAEVSSDGFSATAVAVAPLGFERLLVIIGI